MNSEQIYVGGYRGYSIYAQVHPVNKQLHSFTTGGTNEVFSNYLSIERYIDKKSQFKK